MDTRVTIAFWAIDILLFAGPFVMPGLIPAWTAWIAVAVAAIMLLYALYPRGIWPFGQVSSAFNEEANEGRSMKVGIRMVNSAGNVFHNPRVRGAETAIEMENSDNNRFVNPDLEDGPGRNEAEQKVPSKK